MNTIADTPTLSAADRCDRCGAPAFARIEMHGHGDLLFCAHHSRVHEAKLREVAVAIRDRSGHEIEPGNLNFAN